MLGLHYVPGGHGNHVSGHRGQNGMDVRQRGGTEWANVTGRDCRGCTVPEGPGVVASFRRMCTYRNLSGTPAGLDRHTGPDC